MQARMKTPLYVLPDALQGLLATNKATEHQGLPEVTATLVHLRASQINGCSFCVDMHSRELKKAGQRDEKIWAVSGWRESPYFNAAERAALELTEALTRIADRPDAVSDAVWEEATRHYDEKALAALIIQIGLINIFNRVNVAIRQPVGELKASESQSAAA